eukprot:3834588-Pleurochrysis_carterae.AAC.1
MFWKTARHTQKKISANASSATAESALLLCFRCKLRKRSQEGKRRSKLELEATWVKARKSEDSDRDCV